MNTEKEHNEMTPSTSFLQDPYGLLQVPKATQPFPDLPFILEKHDLAKVPLESYEEPKEGVIPKRMNYIYIVNPMKNKCHRETIEHFRKIYPDYMITLWITDPSYSPDEKDKLIQWAQKNKIHLLDSRILDGNIGPSEPMYRLELLRRNYAAASDQLRVAILYHFGGIYSDIDVIADPNQVLPDVLEAPHGLYMHNGFVRFSRYNIHPFMLNNGKNIDLSDFREKSGCSNDLILAVRHCPTLQKLQVKIASKYQLPIVQILEDQSYMDPGSGRNIPFNKEQPWLTNYLLMQWTIAVTGPTPLFETYTQEFPQFKNELCAADENGKVNDSFFFTNELSWIKPQTNQIAFPEHAIEIGVTGLLYDLTIEPISLRLERYMSFLSNEQIIDVLKILSQHYSKQLENVKFVFPRNPELHSLLLQHANKIPALSILALTEAKKIEPALEKETVSVGTNIKSDKNETEILHQHSTMQSDNSTEARTTRHGFFQPLVEFFNPSKQVLDDLFRHGRNWMKSNR